MLRPFHRLVATFALSAILQFPSVKLGSATVKYELLSTIREDTPPNSIMSSSPGAARYKPAAQSDTVKDMDGNVYHVVKIGNQRWLQENLKTSHFRNGAAIRE